MNFNMEIIPLLEIVASTTAPTVVRYLSNKVNNWLGDKIENKSNDLTQDLTKLRTEIDQIKSEIDTKKDKQEELTDSDIRRLSEMIHRLNSVQKLNRVNMISNEDFTDWSIKQRKEEKIRSEDLAFVIERELEVLIAKSGSGGLLLSNDTRRRLQDMAVALKINAEVLEEEKSKPSMGLRIDEERIREQRRLLDLNIYQAKDLLSKIEIKKSM